MSRNRKLAEMKSHYRVHRILDHGGDQETHFSCPKCSGHLRRMLTFRAGNGDRKAFDRLNHNDARLFPDDPQEQPVLPFSLRGSRA